MRHAPATYEEFLHTPKRDIIAMQNDFYGMEDFELLMNYILRYEKELKANKHVQKLISEGKTVINETLYEDLHYGEN